MIKQGDKIIYRGDSLEDMGLLMNKLYVCQGTATCGGCPETTHIDIGIKHKNKYLMCGTCENIISIDDVYYIPDSLFRHATPEEIASNNERIAG